MDKTKNLLKSEMTVEDVSRIIMQAANEWVEKTHKKQLENQVDKWTNIKAFVAGAEFVLEFLTKEDTI